MSRALAVLCLAALVACATAGELEIEPIQEDSGTPGITTGTYALVQDGRVVGVLQRYSATFGRRAGPADDRPASPVAGHLARLWDRQAGLLTTLHDRLMAARCQFARQAALARLQLAGAAAAGTVVPGNPGSGALPDGPLQLHTPVVPTATKPLLPTRPLFGAAEPHPPHRHRHHHHHMPLMERRAVGAELPVEDMDVPVEVAEPVWTAPMMLRRPAREEPLPIEEPFLIGGAIPDPALVDLLGLPTDLPLDEELVAEEEPGMFFASRPFIPEFEEAGPSEAWAEPEPPQSDSLPPLLAMLLGRLHEARHSAHDAHADHPAHGPLGRRGGCHHAGHMPGHGHMPVFDPMPRVAVLNDGPVGARDWVPLEESMPGSPLQPGAQWRLFGEDGSVNWGLVTFVALAVACAAVWGAMFVQYAAFCRARDAHMAGAAFIARADGDAGAGALKPLLREGHSNAGMELDSPKKGGVEHAAAHVAGAHPAAKVLHYEPLKSSDDEQ